VAHNNLHNRVHGMDHDDDQDEARPGRDDHHGRDGSVTFNQFDITDYLHADNKADGSAVERFIFQVDGVEQSGAHVTLPGLGSDFGMYFIVDAILDPANGAPPHFSKLDISLMVDPGNNDGAASATTAGVGFAHGTSGDFALATGSLVSAALSINADPVPNTRHANFVEQITPTKAGLEAFGDSLKTGDQLRELLTTLGSNPPFDLIPLPGGDFTVVVNGGTGTVQLTTQNSLRLSVDDLSRDHGARWSCVGDGH
jgi:hypothetical protein